MLSQIVLPILLTAASAFALPSSKRGGYSSGCLTAGEAAAIVNNWDGFFIGHFGPLDKTLASNFKAYNYGFTNNQDIPWATSRDNYHQQIAAGLNPATNDDVQIDSGPVFILNTCDKIILRWKATTKTTALNEKKTGVKAGTITVYHGIDIITVDLNSRLMVEVVSSSDILNHEEALGEKLSP